MLLAESAVLICVTNLVGITIAVTFFIFTAAAQNAPSKSTEATLCFHLAL